MYNEIFFLQISTLKFKSFQNDPGSMLICDNPENPNDRRLVGMAALGPNYCGTDVISALFTNILHYEEWIDNVLKGIRAYKAKITG